MARAEGRWRGPSGAELLGGAPRLQRSGRGGRERARPNHASWVLPARAPRSEAHTGGASAAGGRAGRVDRRIVIANERDRLRIRIWAAVAAIGARIGGWFFSHAGN